MGTIKHATLNGHGDPYTKSSRWDIVKTFQLYMHAWNVKIQVIIGPYWLNVI